jgi:Family of unknown function (DUF5309)
MSVKGMFASDMSIPGDRKSNMNGLNGALVQLNAVNMAPLLSMVGAQTTRGYRSTSVEWTEKQHLTGLGFVVGNLGAALGCVLQVADSSWITENMIFLIPSTGEYIFVTGVSGNTINVKRGYGNNFKAPIVPTSTSHVMIQRIGTAFHEGSERPSAVANLPGIPRVNYTQIFRNTWAITRTARMVEYNLGDLKARLKRDTLMMHTQDIERAMLLGIKTNGVMNNQPHRSFDGILRQIQTNIASPADGILTKPMMDTFLEVVFSHTIEGYANERIAICGRHAITMVNRLVEMNTQYILTEQTKKYGQDISTWVTPHGNITLMPHELLTNMPGHHSDIILLHPRSVHAYYMYEGEDDCMADDCAVGGIDADIGGLISELTIALKGELTAGILTGICDVAATPQLMQMVEPHKAPVHSGC